jgi:cell division septum initiation protein DivIVA
LRIGPNEIDVELPRALVGGLKQGPTEELLHRVAADYAQLYDENRKLKAAIDRLELRAKEPVAAPEANGAPETNGAPQAVPAPIEQVVAQPAVREHREVDDLARVVLGAAQRAAREMRESARLDCELMLKKASTRAHEIERAAERARAEKEGDLQQLEALRRETAARMRASLRTILGDI